MAFDSKNLSALSYANGFTLWHYKTSDVAANVDTTGYFNAAAGMLSVGDFIFLNASLSGTPENGVMVVLSNAGGVVDVSNMSGFGLLDSD